MHKYFTVHTAYDLASGAEDEALTLAFLRTLGNNGAWGPFVVVVGARHCDHPLAEPAALFKGDKVWRKLLRRMLVAIDGHDEDGGA